MTQPTDGTAANWLAGAFATVATALATVLGWISTRLHRRTDSLDQRVNLLEVNAQTSAKAATDRAEIKQELREFVARSEMQWRDLRLDAQTQHNLILDRLTRLSAQIVRRAP